MTEQVFYRNLNQTKAGGQAWSIAELKGLMGKGKVQRYADCVVMRDMRVKTTPSTQERIMAGAYREVHAWFIGTPIAEGRLSADVVKTLQAADLIEVTYNPRRGPDFVTRDGRVVVAADLVMLAADGRAYAAGIR